MDEGLDVLQAALASVSEKGTAPQLARV
jgi:hypothetical protein